MLLQALGIDLNTVLDIFRTKILILCSNIVIELYCMYIHDVVFSEL